MAGGKGPCELAEGDVRRLPLTVLVSNDPRNRTEASAEQENIGEPDSNEGEGQEVACTNIVLATQGSQVVVGLPSRSKEADNWGEDDEFEYVGVDDEKEKYKDLVLDDEAVDPDYDPSSDEDNDGLAIDDEESCESIKKLSYKHNCASTAGMDNNCMATNSWMALEEILGRWEDSFDAAYNFKAELERVCNYTISVCRSSPSRSITSGVTETSPITRSRARALNLDVAAPIKIKKTTRGKGQVNKIPQAPLMALLHPYSVSPAADSILRSSMFVPLAASCTRDMGLTETHQCGYAWTMKKPSHPSSLRLAPSHDPYSALR
ncbi:hypothetical protein E2562_032724 [Oryza meyeriana var. granulata]|uniref:Uncharacterized protein n=1 Tax=Oryza meyeriana var. granulata TaxID=110450 RepID=A0A6G1ERY3_9ORYZ|nr:hypothetical protein E2562_032724 [Oryza meyeriana var. granulata]